MLKKYLFKYEQVPDDCQNNSLFVNGINYTLKGLIATIVILCIGSGMYVMMAYLFAGAVPIIMKKYGSSNEYIALMLTTIPYALNMVITPIVSFKSDRLRTRLGRRMPYLLFATPLMALFLAGMGWINQISALIMRVFPECSSSVPLWLLGGMIVGYQFFFLIIGSVIYYVFPDVIPEKYIGRFMALFQLSGALAGFVFSRYFFKYVETDLPYLFSGLSVLFTLMMLLMIFCVKEGTYPQTVNEGKGVTNAVVTYVKECYSIPFYYSFFMMMALSEVSMVCRTMFNSLYATETLGLSADEYGKIFGWGSLIGVIIGYPLGMLVDKMGSLKIYASGLFLVILVNLWGFFFVHDYNTFFWVTMLLGVVYAIQMTSTLPVFVDILPKNLYGQFSSANALLRAAFMVVAGWGGGKLFDYLKNYQYIYLWDFCFTTFAFVCFVILYISWSRRGGREHYIAPIQYNEPC